jgi:hypothetical protein
MRGLVTTVAVAVSLAAAVVGVGFGIEAAVLGKPDRGQIQVIHAITRLLPYTTSHGQMTINGTRLATSCRTRWLKQRLRTIVKVAHGGEIQEIGRHLQDDTKQRFARFELAGCPRVLRKWLATQINAGTRIVDTRGVLDGMAIDRLRFPWAALGLTVYVLRSSGLPVALRLMGPAVEGFTRLRYTGLLATMLRYQASGAARA